MHAASKYSAETERVALDGTAVAELATNILLGKGCAPDIATDVAAHLLDADRSGVESHGLWRVLQYAQYYDTGYLQADVRPELRQNAQGAWLVDGRGGIGIPAMSLATRDVLARVRQNGMAAIAVSAVGHTGRLGAYAEMAAEAGCLAIIIGGGGRENWRLVAPYGGRKALMSTNPYSIGIPGGKRGPVIVDFATSAAAAGWVYGARIAGTTLPEGILIDKNGDPTTNPQDYFDGGAILTAGGPKGYALAVAAEMIAEAMLGPATTECNWLMLVLKCDLYQTPHRMQQIAEDILAELRDCPPAKGFDRVEVPGEREADARRRNAGKPVFLPSATWGQIEDLARAMDLTVPAALDPKKWEYT